MGWTCRRVEPRHSVDDSANANDEKSEIETGTLKSP